MGARRKEQLLTARKVRTLHTEVGSEMSRVSAELGEDMRSSHWREQQEHRPALAAWANCPGAESSVAGSANLPAPTPRPSDLGGLICMAQAQGLGLGCVYRVRQRCGKTENTPSAAFGFC